MTEERGKKSGKRDENSQKNVMLLVGDSSLICSHSPPTCHGVKNHTTRTVPKMPGGWIY